MTADFRARAELAQPDAEGPTHRITPDDFRRWWRETGSASPAPSPEMVLTANAWAQYCLDHWGRPAPQPVPVSERLPGDELCWWFEADEDCGYGSNWTLLRIRGSAIGYTHWLPAHALPLPGEVEG